MILTGSEIIRHVEEGRIHINPFQEQRIGPNSYDLTLGDTLVTYQDRILDMRSPAVTKTIRIPDEGFVLQPGEVYLGSTVEECGSDHFVCCLEGRSSVGRLGIQIHLTAGFGDLGFKSRWTLEIVVTKPVRIYAGVRICQAFFTRVCGAVGSRYKGKYATQTEPTPSGMWQDFIHKESSNE